MSGARTLKNWISRNEAPQPPKRSEVKAVLAAPEIGPAGERIAQLNLKVPEGVKHQYRQIAARDRLSMIELFYLMMQAYEEKQNRTR
jgi:hypothetical protein